MRVGCMKHLGKADLLPQTFSSNNVLPEPVTNEYSDLERNPHKQKSLRPLTVEKVIGTLGALDESSGTGPDLDQPEYLRNVGTPLRTRSCN